jgi:hypothetical protein
VCLLFSLRDICVFFMITISWYSYSTVVWPPIPHVAMTCMISDLR